MKVNYKRAQAKRTQAEARCMANDIFAAMVNANLEAETVIMLAAKRYFKLGEKRMREFVEVIKAVKREYEEYRIDDVFGYKAKEEFADIGIDIHELIEEPETLEMAINMYMRQIHPNITDREAEFMQSELLAMKKAAGA